MDQTTPSLQEIQDKIRAAATAAGINPDTALRIANAESVFSNTAKNTRSSARGLFQVIDQTWKDLGGDPKLRNDVDENIRIGIKAISNNRDAFLKKYGTEPDTKQLYGMHFLGPSQAIRVFNSAEDAAIKNIVPKKVIKANPFLDKMSVADFINFTQTKMDKKGTVTPSATAVAKNETTSVPMPQAPKETMRQAPTKPATPRAAPMNRDMLASLGPSYQAALAAMTLSDSSDDDDDEALAERYAERFGDQGNEVVPSTLGDIKLSYASPFEEAPVQMSEGGDPSIPYPTDMSFDDIPEMPPNPTPEQQAEFLRKVEQMDARAYWKRRGPNSADELNYSPSRKMMDELYSGMGTEIPDSRDNTKMPIPTDDQMEQRKRDRYYANGGDVGVQKLAFGGIPYKPSAIIPSAVKNSVGQAQADLDAYNQQVSSYNAQMEDYKRRVDEYNTKASAYNEQRGQYLSSYIGGENPTVYVSSRGSYRPVFGGGSAIPVNARNLNVIPYGNIPGLDKVPGYMIRQGEYRSLEKPTDPGNAPGSEPTAPTQPNVGAAQAALAAAKDKQRRLQLTYDVMEDPERFNLSMPAMFAEGGEASASDMLKQLKQAVVPAQIRTFIETVMMNKEDRAGRPVTEKDFSESELRQILDTIGTARKNRAKEKGLNSTYTPTSKDISLDKLFEKMMGKDPAFQKAKARTEAEKKHFESGSGSVNYMDYPGFLSGVRDSTLSKEGAIRNTLGRFVYETLPDGRIRVKDTYDFKDDLVTELGQRPSAAYKDMGTMGKLGTILVDTLNNPMDLQSEEGGTKVGRATLPSRVGSAFIGQNGRPVDITLDPRELMPGYAGYAQGGPVHRADGSPVYGEIPDSGPITADTRAAMSNFQVPNAREALAALRKIYGEGVSNAESLVRGSLAAVPGTFGDIGQEFDIRGLRNLPTTEQLLKKYPQRMTQPTAETAKFEEVGQYMPPPIPPAAVSGTAKAMMKGLKESGPQVESIMRKIAPAAEPFNIVRPTGGEFATVKSMSEAPISRFDSTLAKLFESRAEPQYASVNKFFDTKFRDYFKKQAGSVSDPVREGLISGKIKIPKDSPLEEMFPEALIKAARDGDLTAMKLIEKQLDEATSIKSYKKSDVREYDSDILASDEMRSSILQQMKRNPDIIPDAMLLRLAKKNASNLSPEKAAQTVADIRAKLKANPELFSTVYEEKIMRMMPERLTEVVTPEYMEKYPSLYGNVKNIFDSRQGIMALKGAAPVLDVESPPRLFGMTLNRMHELMQRLPEKELERMDVPTVLNKVIQLDKVSNEVAGYANQAEKLISAGKAVPEKLTTYGTKPFTTADEQGFMWREITEPDAAAIQGKLLGNSIGGYARPGSYGSLSKGRTAIDNGEVRLFGLYDKNNQLMTNVEYVTNKAETLKNSIPQFYGNGPATGNVSPDNFVPQVVELINKLNPDNIPPSIKQLLRDSGISITK